MKKILFIGLFILIAGFSLVIYKNKSRNISSISPDILNEENQGGPVEELHPLAVEYMRKQAYPGSNITIEQALPAGSNYSRYIASYKSDGLKIFALLTIPQGNPPTGGWPVIIFNHGYIPPSEYRTTEKYVAYTDAFSKSGYILLRPDYRGHGNSDGNPEGAYYSPAYTIDVLNAVSSIKKLTDPENENKLLVNPNNIGMWGHSMGGSITLRSMVTVKDIKAGVIWAGVVGSYQDMGENWHRSRPWTPSQKEQTFRRPGRQILIDKYGSFSENPDFWNLISPINYVGDISGPVQIHHGTADEDVPVLFSRKLNEALIKSGKNVEYHVYDGDDHNISNNLSPALKKSVDFFDKYLKPESK